MIFLWWQIPFFNMKSVHKHYTTSFLVKFHLKLWCYCSSICIFPLICIVYASATCDENSCCENLWYLGFPHLKYTNNYTRSKPSFYQFQFDWKIEIDLDHTSHYGGNSSNHIWCMLSCLFDINVSFNLHWNALEQKLMANPKVNQKNINQTFLKLFCEWRYDEIQLASKQNTITIQYQ